MSDQEKAHAQHLPGMLDALLEGLQVIDFDYRYVYVNAAAAKHGRTTPQALVGRTLIECYPGIEQSDMFSHLRRCLEQRSTHLLENEFRYPDGGSAHFELRIEPVPEGACVLSVDVSVRKQVESKLRESEARLAHAQRMEAMGMLSAGIAHDFNQLLCVILGHGELALLRPEGPQPEDVHGIIEAARRSAELTRQLLAYGRRQVLRPQVVDPAALVSSTAVMLRRTLGAHIELSVQVGAPLGRIEVDPAKLEQVVMNLVLNARDALPEGGKITLALGEVVLDEEYVAVHPDAHVGPHVLLSVTDNGVGMDAATQARVFEPFFTTKEPGRGTGLGLATVYGIVKQSGGTIWLYSEPGHGSTFKLYFPRSERIPSMPAPKPTPSIAPRPDGGRQKILVAEDDPLLRRLTEVALTNAGFDVILAASGDEALRLCEANRPLSLLITDVILPGLRGPELIVAAYRVQPDLKVLCTSGHASAALEEQNMLPAGVTFLEKPYLPSALVAAARRVIAES